MDIWLNSSNERAGKPEWTAQEIRALNIEHRKHVTKYRDELKARLEKEKAKPSGK